MLLPSIVIDAHRQRQNHHDADPRTKANRGFHKKRQETSQKKAHEERLLETKRALENSLHPDPHTQRATKRGKKEREIKTKLIDATTRSDAGSWEKGKQHTWHHEARSIFCILSFNDPFGRSLCIGVFPSSFATVLFCVPGAFFS